MKSKSKSEIVVASIIIYFMVAAMTLGAITAAMFLGATSTNVIWFFVLFVCWTAARSYYKEQMKENGHV